ncbi:MAG TPA: hypothetical protein PKH48_06780 [Methanofastidiosum sp.]|jgi:hypothetical protein|nr:hypothetical protein [Methanofastidiosum sp.]
MQIRKGRRKIGHLSKKERKTVCLMCDVKCRHFKPGKGSFAQLKGHKLRDATIPFADCRHYRFYGVLNKSLLSSNRERAFGGTA